METTWECTGSTCHEKTRTRVAVGGKYHLLEMNENICAWIPKIVGHSMARTLTETSGRTWSVGLTNRLLRVVGKNSQAARI